ncbi:MAG: copper resistance protein [Microbacteriaceae bacterium]|nr:transporter [Microbacteriaceae bacterium]MDQ1548897.1 copper resistance protein [Microbacteriaceae bacterium]
MIVNRRVLKFAAVAVIAVGSVVGIAAPAQAHNYLVQSTPSAGEVLTSLPARFSIITNDVLLNVAHGSGFALQVRDQAGLYYGDGCVSVNGPGMSTAAALGAPGRYTVVWQLISTDGHTVSDEFTFTWKPASADAVVSTGSKSAPDCHGTLSPNGAANLPAAPTPAPSAASQSEALSTVLWVGGAILAVGIAVVVTVLATSRTKPQPTDGPKRKPE